jgi:hypothetical protein
MQFARFSPVSKASGAQALVRLLAWVVLVVLAQPATANIAILNGVEGVSNGQAISGEVMVRANILGQPDLVIFEMTGPVSFTTVRTGNQPSMMVNPQTGQDMPWDTAAVPDGDYALTVRAVVENGNDRQQTIHFAVRNTLTETEQNDTVVVVDTPETPANDPQPQQPTEPDSGGDEAEAPQVVVIGGDSDDQDDLSVIDDLQAAQELPAVRFADTVEAYTRGSAANLDVLVAGTMPEDGSIVAIAWSAGETRIVDEFAHELDLNDPGVLADRLDLLPAGENEIQLLVRRSSQVHAIVRLSIEVVVPVVEPADLPEVSIEAVPSAYVRGSGQPLTVTIDGELPENADVLVLAWSRAEARLVDEFAFVLGSDRRVPASALDKLPAGRVQLQLLTRVAGEVVQRVGYRFAVELPAAPEPPVEEEEVALPAVGFASAPAVYVMGSGIDLQLSASGPLPADGDVVVIAWSNSEQRMIDPFAFTIASDDAWAIPAAKMELLPAGSTQLQLLVRRNSHAEALVTHNLTIEPAQPDEPESPVEPAPSARPVAAFVQTPSSYTVGIDNGIQLATTGTFDETTDLLVIAWSVAQSRLVDDFAFTLREGPFVISPDRMAMLPPGDVILQLLPREGNAPYAQVQHRVTVVNADYEGGGTLNPSPGDGGAGDSGDNGQGSTDEEPQTGDEPSGGDEPQQDSYSIAFATGAPAEHVRGSGVPLNLSLTAGLPGGSTVEVRAWSYGNQAYVTMFALTLAGSPWRVESSRLDTLTDGEYRIDATLYVPGRPAMMASHAITVTAAGQPGDDATPITVIDGFASFTPSSDTRVIYVANNGNDSNNGLSEQSPVRTLDKAYALLRDGYPDWILLKRGHTFDLNPNDDGAFRWWRRSGRSADEPIVIGAYGDLSQPRPLIRSNGRGVFRSFRGDYVVLNDLHLNANYRDPHSPQYNASLDNEVGMWVNSGVGLFFQGCLIEHFRTNIVMQDYPEPASPTIRDIRMHRCVLRNAYSHGDADAHGMFVNFASGFTITETVFDHNGWHEDVPDSVRRGRNHNAYFAHCDNVALVENVFARGSYEDLKFRNENGGNRCSNLLVKDNLFLACAYAIGFDSNNGDGYASPIVYEDVVVTGNVFVRTIGWPLDNPGGPTMRIGWMDGGDFTNNLYCDPDPRNQRPQAIEIKMNTQMQDIVVVGNTSALSSLPGIYIFPSTANTAGLTLADNPNNLPDAYYVDPGRTLESYISSATNALSIDSFIVRMSDQRLGDWNEAYTGAAVADYYRDGYERTLFD